MSSMIRSVGITYLEQAGADGSSKQSARTVDARTSTTAKVTKRIVPRMVRERLCGVDWSLAKTYSARVFVPEGRRETGGPALFRPRFRPRSEGTRLNSSH